MTSPDTSAKIVRLRAQAQAAAWIARLNNPKHSVQEERDLQHWINESEEHARAWELAEVVWKETGTLIKEVGSAMAAAEDFTGKYKQLDRFAAIRSFDLLTKIILAICGTTSAFLSARGVYGLFGASWLAAGAFAVVVQFVLLVALWEFPRKPFRIQALLVSTCGVAMLLSIGSTYYESYHAATDDAVALTRDRMARALLTAEIQEANEAAARNAPNASEPERGSAEWRSKTSDTTGQTERALHTSPVVSESIEELTRPDLTMADLQRIYNNLETEGTVITQEPVRRVNSLFAVSIMEILSLMVAVIRCAIVEAHLRRMALDQATRQARATQRVQESTADPDAEDVERAWEIALASELNSSGIECRRLVVDLLPRYRALSWLAGTGLNCPTALFDPDVFARRPAALHGALITGAVFRTTEGELIPGARWDQWIRFLLAKLPNAPAGRHATVA